MSHVVLRSRASRWTAVVAVVASALSGGAAVVSSAPASATTASSVCGTAAIVGVQTTTAELMRWTDPQPKTAGGIGSAAAAGSGWRNARLLASDGATGALYAVLDDGTLRRYTFNGSTYGNGTEIGRGWGAATRLITMGTSMLYATFNDGLMRSYEIVNGAIAAGSGQEIGQGWNSMGPVANGGGGVLYAVDKATGALFWYKHTTFPEPSTSWEQRREVGTGWSGMTQLLGGGDGILYGVDAQGQLWFYDHAAPQSGAASWAAGSGSKVGPGWGAFRALTVNPDACSAGRLAPAANPYGSSTSAPGTMTPRMRFIVDQVKRAFPEFSGSRCFTYAGGQDHGNGNAADCALGAIGTMPTAEQQQVMTELKLWLTRHAGTLKVQYTIWQDRVWNIDKDSPSSLGRCLKYGCRAPTTPDEVRLGHWDHVHISATNPANDLP
ncbi:MAG: tachylectin-related carbohydrate-binding protein [Angustibacter sp.]